MSTTIELAQHIRDHLNVQPAGIAEHLVNLRDADVADVLNELRSAESAAVLELLREPRRIKIVARPTLRRRAAILADLEPTLAAAILNLLPTDQRTEIVRQMSVHERQRLLPQLEASARAEVERILQYPDRSAGGIMTTEFVRLEPAMTVAQALEGIREVARERDSIYACYVLDTAGKLLGAVSLRDLVVADPNRIVGEVMRRNPVSIAASDDRIDAARKIGKYNLLARNSVVTHDGIQRESSCLTHIVDTSDTVRTVAMGLRTWVASIDEL